MTMGKSAEQHFDEVRKQAKQLSKQAKDLAKEAKLDERASDLLAQASDLAERARDSDALAKAQDATVDFLKAAREQIEERKLDEKAADLARRTAELGERVRESEQYRQARDSAAEATDKTLASVGDWLATGPAADKLGVRPARPARRVGGWLLAGAGVAAGFAAGILYGARKSETVEELERVASRVGQDTPDLGAPADDKPIADEVRTRLGADPRTAGLPKLNINVAEHTVFVRGAVPEGTDTEAVREVIATVPGVEDIDLQVNVISVEEDGA